MQPNLKKRRKGIEQSYLETQVLGLKRRLSLTQLILMGVGAVVGAGIYVTTGSAAANFAGPAVIISFLLAGIPCLFAAFCYGELCAAFPVAGSGYSYVYLIMGERAAWWTAWFSLLQFGISCNAVAAGFSSYANALLKSFCLPLPDALVHSTIGLAGAFGTQITFAWRFDCLGFLSVVIVTFFLLRGIEETARINSLIVVLKVGLLLLFVVMGGFWVQKGNFLPFLPSSQGGLHYGVWGVLGAASLLFFAYTGFESVSSASAEAKNPVRDMPWSIVGCLLICTLLYIAVAIVLVGIVPYHKLDVSDPLALATALMQKPWLGFLIMTGATIGLFSGLFGYLYAQSRVLMKMSLDGLIPEFFSRISKKSRVPWGGILIIGFVVALITAIFPFEMTGDFICVGIAAEYIMICLNVMICRNTMPELKRPFKVPFFAFHVRGVWIGIVPLLGVVCCSVMIIPLLANMISAFAHGNPMPVVFAVLYVLLGGSLYHFYGRKYSKLGRALRVEKKDIYGNDA